MKKILTKKEIILIISVVIAITLLGVGAWFYIDYSTQKKEEKSQKTVETADQCGDLVADNGVMSGTAPFKPSLKAKLTGDYDKGGAICQWTINNVPIPNTYTVKGNCVLGGRTFSTAGSYKIVYKVDGLSGCPKSATIVVK